MFADFVMLQAISSNKKIKIGFLIARKAKFLIHIGKTTIRTEEIVVDDASS